MIYKTRSKMDSVWDDKCLEGKEIKGVKECQGGWAFQYDGQGLHWGRLEQNVKPECCPIEII